MSIVSNHSPETIYEMNGISYEPTPEDWQEYRDWLDSQPAEEWPEPGPEEAA